MQVRLTHIGPVEADRSPEPTAGSPIALAPPAPHDSTLNARSSVRQTVTKKTLNSEIKQALNTAKRA